MRFPSHLISFSALLLAAACGGGGGGTAGPTSGGDYPTTPVTPITPSAPVSTNAVTVDNDFFSPSAIQVPPGTTVTWSWAQGAAIHNVTFGDGVGSGNKSGSGASFSRTFPTAGTFTYSCTLHGGMNGSVLVK